MNSGSDEKAVKYWLVLVAIVCVLVFLRAVDAEEGKIIVGATFIGIVIAAIAIGKF